jgi:predicted nucleic acid-binding protein
LNYLIDTNVLIECAKARPNVRVQTWFTGLLPVQVVLSPIVMAEFLAGIFRLPRGSARTNAVVFLREALETFVWIELDQRAAAVFGLIRSRLRSRIRHNDLWLGAIAQANGFTVATRNVRDFRVQGVAYFNPF